MKAIDAHGDFQKHIDETKRIDSKHFIKVCKSGKACRYIMSTNDHFYCTKNTEFKKFLDKMVKEKQMEAVEDNCKGL